MIKGNVNAEFISISKLFDKVFPIVGEKDLESFKIQAQQPAPQEGEGGGVPGVASQPAQAGGVPGAEVINMNPGGGFGGL